MYFIDTHCHLDFLESISDVISRAQAQKVRQYIVPSVTLKSATNIVTLTQTYENVFGAVGIHPSELGEYQTDIQLGSTFRTLEAIFKSHYPNIVAVGECGLDFSQIQNDTEKTLQRKTLHHHFRWADEYHLPIIIHNRKANEDILNYLEEFSDVTGVLHCFTGSKAFLKQILSTSFYIGIGGLVTLDTGLQEVVEAIPMERIILETDSPYLTPQPIKNQNPWPNEPANIVYTAQKLAEIKGIAVNEVAAITTQNAQKLFSLPQ